MPFTKSLTTRLTLRLMGSYAADLDLSDATDALDKTITQVLANGNADNQANRLYHDQQVINNTDYTWDLVTVTDAFGDVLGWNTLVGLLIVNTNTVATEYCEIILHDEADVLIANAVELISIAGTLTDEVVRHKINPLGFFMAWAPVDGYVIDGTHKEVVVSTTGSADSVTVDLIAIGSV